MGRVTIWLRLRLEDFKFRVREMVRRALRKLVEIAITDLDLMGSVRDVQSSAAFEREHLTKAAHFKSRPQLYRHALAQAGDDGLFLEFGVYKGDSINRLAELKPAVRWYGFDSFVGLPEAWTPGARAGAFSIAGRLPPVRNNVTLIKGFFEQTMAPFAAQHPNEKVAFLHIDCDLYSATRTVFEHLGDRLQPGCIIVFDEFINYAGWQDAEYKAFMEFIGAKGRRFEYIGYVRTGGQVAVRLT
jgi:methyltransferase family protein